MSAGPASGTAVSDADLPRHVAGLVMCNDISARDVQLTKGQFYESKSYPTFTPTGPAWSCSRTASSPACARAAAAPVGQRRAPPGRDGGRPDHRADGGPVAAVRLPAARSGRPAAAPLKWRTFFARRERNPAYLKAGDVITASVASADGTLDLGTQRTVVRDAPS
jgi:hypothetical protein